ncbi:hypothetical protein C2S53_014243 [Perilla frutescens var. hirtella]|uniref:F-box domain-containing protein n=1 Tax=Perilla frutescens var. hirtella TaxID=608512 RepID=A0AAD4JPZ7_PERFH|nr:hypothetical protein C2S53_014243 [Perilla frutescens var. hirtella]
MDMKMKIKEGADNVDHFARIPEDLLLSILSRLENLKYMCRCSLVSKRFALTIYQSKAVSLTLPSTEIPSNALADQIDELFPKLAGLTSEEIIRFIKSSSIKVLKFFPFLQNFRELRSISLVFTCPRTLCSSSLFKMKVKFSNGGAVVKHFVSLLADSVLKNTERGYYDIEQPYERIDHRGSVSGTFLPFGCCIDWLLVLCLLIKCQPLLESITITNSKKQGKLVLRDEQLIAWRNSFVPGGFLNDFTPYSRTKGWIGKLRLPFSEYLLRGVNYVIARPKRRPGYNAGTVDDDAVTWEYAGDAKLLGEAVDAFLREYGDPFITSELID